MGRRENTKRRNAKRRSKIIRGGSSEDSQTSSEDSPEQQKTKSERQQERLARVRVKAIALAERRARDKEAFSNLLLKEHILGKILKLILKYIIMNTRENGTINASERRDVGLDANRYLYKYFS